MYAASADEKTPKLEKTFESLDLSPELKAFLTSREPKLYEFEDELTGESKTVVSFKHKLHINAKLPLGYGVSGGAARTIILSEFGERPPLTRDLDIISIDEFQPDRTLSEGLAAKYSGRDAKYGYGIKHESLQSYFFQRDFTINEALVYQDRVYVTPEALRDLKDKVVRPTDYESGAWFSSYRQRQGLHPKLVLKALRMQIEFEEAYGYGEFKGVEDWQFDTGAVPAFYIALQLDKAFERGDALAFKFFTKLVEVGTVVPYPEETNGPQLAAESSYKLALALQWHFRERGRCPFEFSRPDLNQIQEMRRFADTEGPPPDDEEYEFYADLAEAHFPSIRGGSPKSRREKGQKP